MPAAKSVWSRIAATQNPWPLAALQGFVLRGYRMSFVRYFALTVKDVKKARAFLAGLTAPPGEGPRLTSAEPWAVKPLTCLNVGFTWPGLNALGLPSTSLSSFQNDDNCAPFVNGSAASAAYVGDVGQSDPSLWRIDDRDFHVMLALFAIDEPTLSVAAEDLAARLKPGFGPPDPARVFDSQGLEGGSVYFGYQDGIAQPAIAGNPFAREPDGSQPMVDSGGFFLGTATDGGGYESLSVPYPSTLGQYGTYAAFRILKQDVEGFEKQVESLAPAFGKAFGVTDPAVQKAALMAKLLGRWPNGAPLALFPVNGNAMPPALPRERINNFDYGADPGVTCPYSAHIRRGNPRDSINVNGDPSIHRLQRRAMAYQLPYDPNDRNTGERGLMGLFVGASLAQQFEFLMGNWINSPASGFGPTLDVADPILGTNLSSPPPPPGQQTPGFTETVPTSPGDLTIFPVNSFVATRGSAYLFFPSIDGVRWIGALKS